MGIQENIASLTKMKSSLDLFIVKPLNAFGIGGFMFNINRTTSIRLQSDITDNYVEDNSAIQDHIALRPLTITLDNFVGELVYENETDNKLPFQNLVQKLTTISNLIPDVISSAKNIKAGIDNKKSLIETFADVGPDLWSLIKKLNPKSTKQAQAYLYFKSLRDQKILVSVDTPYEFITNMAIETIVAEQKEDSSDISEFSITLKQIRTASTTLIPFDKSKYQSRGQMQREEQKNIGKAQGKIKSLAKIEYENLKGSK